MKIIPATCQSRYFPDGRFNMAVKISKRLGKYDNAKGLMVTLTYDPKRTGKREAWGVYGGDTRRFLNAINQYRYKRGWPR